jgi:transcriptional repressor NrdR
MTCPFCQHTEHRVVESRVPEAKDAIRRRRECLSCGRRFTTYERVEEMPLAVVKSSGEREPFDRQKLLRGLQRACHKRQVSVALLEVAVQDIETALRNRLRPEVRSSLIGDLALRRLKEIDPVAYVRFASVYRQFADVEEFEEELARLEREPPLPRGQGSLDEHMFGILTEGVDERGAGRQARGRLRALPGGQGAGRGAGRTMGTTTTTATSQEAPDGD